MRTASSASRATPAWPGMVWTPAACAMRFEVILSPIDSMAPGGGPMNATPASATASLNARFSERNP